MYGSIYKWWGRRIKHARLSVKKMTMKRGYNVGHGEMTISLQA